MNTDRTAAERLFNDRYDVVVARMFIYSSDTDNQFGTLVVGNDLADRYNQAIDTPITCSLTAIELAIIYQNGGKPFFMSEKSTVTLYKDLLEHLNDAVRCYDSNSFVRSLPIEDLVVIENFAEWVYRIAKNHMQSLEPTKYVKNSLYGQLAARRGPILRRVPQEDHAAVLVPEHKRVTDEIVEKDFTRTGWR